MKKIIHPTTAYMRCFEQLHAKKIHTRRQVQEAVTNYFHGAPESLTDIIDAFFAEKLSKSATKTFKDLLEKNSQLKKIVQNECHHKLDSYYYTPKTQDEKRLHDLFEPTK